MIKHLKTLTIPKCDSYYWYRTIIMLICMEINHAKKHGFKKTGRQNAVSTYLMDWKKHIRIH